MDVYKHPIVRAATVKGHVKSWINMDGIIDAIESKLNDDWDESGYAVTITIEVREED